MMEGLLSVQGRHEVRLLCCSRTGHVISCFPEQLLVGKGTLQEFKAPCIICTGVGFFGLGSCWT